MKLFFYARTAIVLLLFGGSVLAQEVVLDSYSGQNEITAAEQVRLLPGVHIPLGQTVHIHVGSGGVGGPVLSVDQPGQSGDKPSAAVFNPFKLTREELLELADFNIRLWMDLKDKIRKYGISNPKIFNKDAIL